MELERGSKVEVLQTQKNVFNSHLEQKSANFCLKESDIKYFSLCEKHSLCHSYSNSVSQCKQIIMTCVNKILVIKAGRDVFGSQKIAY